MPQLIIALLVILLVVLILAFLLPLFLGILGAVIVSALLWGPAILGMGLFFLVNRAWKMRRLRLPGMIPQTLVCEAQGTTITVRLKDDARERERNEAWLNAVLLVLLGVVIAGNSALFAPWGIAASETATPNGADARRADQNPFAQAWQTGASWGTSAGALAAIAASIAAVVYSARTFSKRLEGALEKAAANLAALAERHVSAGIEDLRPVEERTAALAAELGVEWPHKPTDHLLTDINRDLEQIIRDPHATVGVHLDEAKRAAAADLHNLDAAFGEWRSVISLYDDVAEDVLAAQSALLAGRLDQIRDAMQQLNAQVLCARDWNAYGEALRAVRDELGRIRNIAQGREPQDGRAEVVSVDEALGILGLTRETATYERAKKQYRRLASFYHPDKTGADDLYMKRVNQAYEIINRYLGIGGRTHE